LPPSRDVVPEARQIAVRKAALAAGTHVVPQARQQKLRRPGLPSVFWHASGMTHGGAPASTVRCSARRLRRDATRG